MALRCTVRWFRVAEGLVAFLANLRSFPECLAQGAYSTTLAAVVEARPSPGGASPVPKD